MNIQPITSQKARALLSKHVNLLEKLPTHGTSKVLYQNPLVLEADELGADELEVGSPTLQQYAVLRNWKGIYELQQNH